MKKKLLVILAGQSNMAGRGYLTENDIDPIPGLTALRRDNVWIPAVDPFNYDRLSMLGISNAADPFEVKGIEFGGQRRAGVGPGRTFGKYMKEAFPDAEIGLVPIAIGGTPVKSWLPGGKDPFSDMYPYDDGIRLAREAMKCGQIAAILWHQGESDASDRTGNYKDLLKTVIGNFRKDLNIPEVPFILGGLGDFLNPEWNAADYNRMIMETAEELEHTGFASAENLNHRGDHLHFDTESQYILGKRYWLVVHSSALG